MVKVNFVKSELVDRKRLKFIKAVGGSPLEDCGGVQGWQKIKDAFMIPDPSGEQRDLKQWCFSASSKGKNFNPTTAPSVDEMNVPFVFVRYANAHCQADSDEEYEDDYDEDGIERCVADTRIVSKLISSLLFYSRMHLDLDLADEHQCPDIVVTGPNPDLPNAIFETTPRMPIPERMPPPTIVGPPIEDAHRQFNLPKDVTDGVSLFVPMINLSIIRAPRWVYKDGADQYSVLLFTAGAVVDSEQKEPHAGCGLVFRPDDQTVISLPLESTLGFAATPARAELRSAIMALQLRDWAAEGFQRIVIGTNSDYVMRGASEHLRKWQQRQWRTRERKSVKNKDLWEILLHGLEKWEKFGVSVQFLLVRREQNAQALDAAKRGALVRSFSLSCSAQSARQKRRLNHMADSPRTIGPRASGRS